MINCAFLVGCAEYKAEKLERLLGVKDDIINMKDALINFCDCSEDNIFIIADTDNAISPPTGFDICKAIADKASEYDKTQINNLFFYYSGHGFISPKDKDALIVPTDTYLNSIEHGTIPLPKIIELIRESFLSVKHIIFILDMCLNIQPLAKGTVRANERINPNLSSEGVIVYYSCYPRKSSYTISEEDEDVLGKGSVFTHVFIDALSDKDSFTAEEIDTFCDNRINYYNRITATTQRPFTDYLGNGMKEVLVKYKHPSLPEGITIDEFREYQKANTVNAQLNEEEIGKVIKFAKKIDPSNGAAITIMGEQCLNKINDFNTKLNNAKPTIISLNAYNTAKSQLNEIYRKTTSKKSIRIDSHDNAELDKSITVICNEILERFALQYTKNANLYEGIKSTAERHQEELLKYTIATTFAINKNQDKDISLLQDKLITFHRYLDQFEGLFIELDKIVNNFHRIVQDLYEYSRKINEVSAKIYKDKPSLYYDTRYNEIYLADLLGLLCQVEQLILSNPLTNDNGSQYF